MCVVPLSSFEPLWFLFLLADANILVRMIQCCEALFHQVLWGSQVNAAMPIVISRVVIVVLVVCLVPPCNAN
jgi:hypothetical protein